METLFYGFVLFLFAAVILTVEGLYFWWVGTHGASAKRIARRLQIMSGDIGRSGERISILKQRRYSRHDGLDRLLHGSKLAARLDHLLVQSGIGWPVDILLGATCAGVLLGLALGTAWGLPALIRWMLAILLAAAPYLMVRRARTRRLVRIEHQLPDAADFIARALRAGHSFANVLQIVGNELPEPLAGEFRLAREEINYGVPMSEALHNMAERIPLTDLRYLIIAVVIQRESGGNLAEILGNISLLIRGRLKLVGQVRVLSAEGRMSAWVLGLLPFAVGCVMTIVNYGYVSMLWTDPTGIRVIQTGLVMIVVGVIWMRKIIRIHI
jgi:tight adherence protein B